MTRHPIARTALTALAGSAFALLPAGMAAAVPTPSPGAATITQAGSSFLTATAISPGQPVRLAGSTGDYLYWSFTASAGQTHDIAVTVTLPPARDRHGASTWTIDVFDGLRRRQACTAGAQTPTATATDTTLALGCTLRRVRTWAEPWSGDPLPGTYYIRLSVTQLPEQDLGLPIEVALLLGVTDDGDTEPEGGELKAPLAPMAKPGKVQTQTVTTATEAEADEDAAEEKGGWRDWLPELSSRWVWTALGGVLGALAGVVGFSLTWRRRRG